jgi:hypothetical protein
MKEVVMTNLTPIGRSARHEIFQSAVQAFLDRSPEDHDPTIEFDGVEFTVTQACKMVWNMPDILPSSGTDGLRDILDFKSCTYAAVARAMYETISAHA